MTHCAKSYHTTSTKTWKEALHHQTPQTCHLQKKLILITGHVSNKKAWTQFTWFRKCSWKLISDGKGLNIITSILASALRCTSWNFNSKWATYSIVWLVRKTFISKPLQMGGMLYYIGSALIDWWFISLPYSKIFFWMFEMLQRTASLGKQGQSLSHCKCLQGVTVGKLIVLMGNTKTFYNI